MPHPLRHHASSYVANLSISPTEFYSTEMHRIDEINHREFAAFTRPTSMKALILDLLLLTMHGFMLLMSFVVLLTIYVIDSGMDIQQVVIILLQSFKLTQQ